MRFGGEMVTCVCVSGPQQCMLCGNLAQEECTDCFNDVLFSQTGFKLFCETCSAQVCVALSALSVISAAIFTQLLSESALITNKLLCPVTHGLLKSRGDFKKTCGEDVVW